MMQANVGGLDKTVRMIAGVVLVALAATGVIGWWGWLGVVPFLTGSLNFCPLYPLLGINTCNLKSD